MCAETNLPPKKEKENLDLILFSIYTTSIVWLLSIFIDTDKVVYI